MRNVGSWSACLIFAISAPLKAAQCANQGMYLHHASQIEQPLQILCLLRLALPPKFARVVAGSNLRLEVGGMVFSCERHPSTRIRLSAGRFRLSVLLKSTEKGLSYPNFCLRSTAICRAPTLSTCDSLVHLSSLCPQLTENFHHLLEPWRINLELSSYYQAHLPMAVKNRTKMQIIPECIAVFPVIFNGATILQLQRNRL